MGIRLDVYRACPAYLLEEPAAKGYGCFGGSNRVRDKANTVTEEEETGGQMSVLIDDLVRVSNAV